MTRCHFNQRNWIRFVFSLCFMLKCSVCCHVHSSWSRSHCFVLLFFSRDIKRAAVHVHVRIKHTAQHQMKRVVKWFNRFDILPQWPFKMRSFVCLTTSRQMKRAIYMIENKPTTSNEMCKYSKRIDESHQLCCFHAVCMSSLPMPLLLMITFLFASVRIGSVWHFLFVFAFYTPRVSCSRVRLNRSVI